MSVYALRVISGPNWGYVIPALTAEEMYLAEADYLNTYRTWDFQITMRFAGGVEVPVLMQQGDDDGIPYYWARCAVNYCVMDAHPGNEHVDGTGYTFTEGE